ncbi:hypothetical protein BLOT_003003 [Blomia tropicalis]|nr:hypothetical protein BLOT_003003 [Blomia tropicalis]
MEEMSMVDVIIHPSIYSSNTNIGGYDYVQLLTIEHMKRFVKENGNGLSMKVISGKTWSVDVIS